MHKRLRKVAVFIDAQNVRGDFRRAFCPADASPSDGWFRPLALGQLIASRGPHKSGNWKELFQGIYLKRTLTIWILWFCVYMVGNGLITWLPTLYRQTFKLPLETSLQYGFLTSAMGLVAAILCALLTGKPPFVGTDGESTRQLAARAAERR